MAAGNFNLGKASGGVLNVQAPDGVTNTSVVLPTSGTVATIDSVVGFKNYIINGNFDIWQRGNGPFTNYNYGADRWVCYNSTATMSSSSAGTNGIQKRIAHIQNVTAGTLFLAQAIELPLVGFGHPFTVGKKFTISIRYSSTTKIRPSLIFRDGLVGANPINLDSTMTSPTYKGGSGIDETVSWTFTVDGTAAATNNCLVVALQAESTIANIYMYQVQLEEGIIPTPFENRHISIEETMCSRYYEKGYIKSWGVATAGVQPLGHTQTYKVTKRVVPTVTLFSSTFSNAGTINSEVSKDSLTVYANSLASGVYSYSSEFSASAEL